MFRLGRGQREHIKREGFRKKKMGGRWIGVGLEVKVKVKKEKETKRSGVEEESMKSKTLISSSKFGLLKVCISNLKVIMRQLTLYYTTLYSVAPTSYEKRSCRHVFITPSDRMTA